MPAQAGTRIDWRDRDRELLDRLRIHPCTIQEVLDIFPSYDTALQRLRKLRKRGKVRLVGRVQLKETGRPRDVYCGWHPKADTLLHELLLTRFLLKFPSQSIRRKNLEPFNHPDAEILIGETRYYVELDTGTMSHKQIEQRFDEYRGALGTILWVTLSEERLQGLRAKAGPIKDIILFTTLDRFLSDPFGSVWTLADGTRVEPTQGEPPSSKVGGD